LPKQTILVGDVRDKLREMPAQSVHCCVTSPPYYGLRDYKIPPSTWGDGWVGCLGNEPTVEMYLNHLVEVFFEVRRVLRDDGTLWLNQGDSYCSHDPGGRRDGEFLNPGGRQSEASKGTRNKAGTFARGQDGLKPKDLMMVPAMAAIALRSAGWYLRSDIIWHKPNPMPESIRDRPTSAHEHVFLLTKKSRYYYDADAIAEPMVKGSSGSTFTEGKTGVNGLGRVSQKPRKQDGHGRRHAGFNDRWDAAEANGSVVTTRNKRNVWTVSTAPYKGAHFATFPPKLVEPMILAGCPEGGTVLDPFLGSGTTLMVADWNGRNGIGIDVNPAYAEMARARICKKGELFTEVSVA
jgi:DNA modification methylase